MLKFEYADKGYTQARAKSNWPRRKRFGVNSTLGREVCGIHEA